MLNFSVDYFSAKFSQERKAVSDVSETVFKAVEIATNVLRLSYPLRTVRCVTTYFNNSPVEPFLQPEHPRLTHPDQQAFAKPRKKYLVVDVHFLFGSHYKSESELASFVVEVAFPQDAERARWKSIIRIRWCDLRYEEFTESERPVPHMMGEIYMNDWM